MFGRNLVLVWIGIFLLSGMFLMGQDGWCPLIVCNGDYLITDDEDFMGYPDYAHVDLSELSRCETITGDLVIYAINLTSLSGLENLTSVGGSLLIYENPALTSLTGLNNLTSVNRMNIMHNPVLTSLQALNDLTDPGESLLIAYNPSLTSVSGLENLKSVNGSISVHTNSSLTSLSGLENLTSVGSLDISWNPALTSLHGLNKLLSVDGEMYISYSPLINLEGLSNLASVGNLSIYANTNLSSFAGLESLTSVRWNLYIYSNSSLTSLIDLSNLTSVGGLHIGYTALTNLEGLDNLTSVGDLIIDGNPNLASLAALENLPSLSGDLWIYDNLSLPTCEAEWLRDNIGVENIWGSINIYNNDDTGTCE